MKTESDLRSLRVTLNGPVAEVQLLGPSKGNAMGPDFWSELPEVFTELDANEEVRAVLLYGSGDNFSYGLDLPGMEPVFRPLLQSRGTDARLRAGFRLQVKALQDAVSSLAQCSKPVVAAVQGWCIGGGIDVITAADVRIAAPSARFSIREVRVGIVADLGSLQRLPAIIGSGATRHLALTGEDFDAVRARELGLVTELADDVVGRGRELAAQIAANPPLVVQGVKQVLNQGSEAAAQAGLDYVQVWNTAFLPSRDFAEAGRAFAEHRPAVFTGD